MVLRKQAFYIIFLLRRFNAVRLVNPLTAKSPGREGPLRILPFLRPIELCSNFQVLTHSNQYKTDCISFAALGVLAT